MGSSFLLFQDSKLFLQNLQGRRFDALGTLDLLEKIVDLAISLLLQPLRLQLEGKAVLRHSTFGLLHPDGAPDRHPDGQERAGDDPHAQSLLGSILHERCHPLLVIVRPRQHFSTGITLGVTPRGLDLGQLDRLQARLFFPTKQFPSTPLLFSRKQALLLFLTASLLESPTGRFCFPDSQSLGFFFLSNSLVLQVHEFMERKQYGTFV